MRDWRQFERGQHFGWIKSCEDESLSDDALAVKFGKVGGVDVHIGERHTIGVSAFDW